MKAIFMLFIVKEKLAWELGNTWKTISSQPATNSSCDLEQDSVHEGDELSCPWWPWAPVLTCNRVTDGSSSPWWHAHCVTHALCASNGLPHGAFTVIANGKCFYDHYFADEDTRFRRSHDFLNFTQLGSDGPGTWPWFQRWASTTTCTAPDTVIDRWEMQCSQGVKRVHIKIKR